MNAAFVPAVLFRPLISYGSHRLGGKNWKAFCRWLVDGTPVGLKPMQHTGYRPTSSSVLKNTDRLPQVAAAIANLPVPTPNTRIVRVVRVQESGQPFASAGRMVISGRMADVCAELDRLAALEGQRS